MRLQDKPEMERKRLQDIKEEEESIQELAYELSKRNNLLFYR